MCWEVFHSNAFVAKRNTVGFEIQTVHHRPTGQRDRSGRAAADGCGCCGPLPLRRATRAPTLEILRLAQGLLGTLASAALMRCRAAAGALGVATDRALVEHRAH